MIILGIDPGFARMGYGVIKKKHRSLQHIAHGVIETSARQTHIERLLNIEKMLTRILKQYQPKIVAVEELFMYKNVKTAMKVGEARGVIMLTLGKQKKEAREFTPLQVKQALTGYGRADKEQVQKMAQKLLCLSALPKPDDAADALAISICCAHSI
ncbi:MAG: crossover junction endodeoxyribonuclease RuvC [Candidatus Jacksonbacteria bacterium]|nr:crossover junction endodeoxyribonuclease RuvC [Candidatus Jacksonbacteria bacterium]